jgi:hypothetical protein
MKYEKMLCWVNEQEKQALINENKNRINIDFVDNAECFITQFKDNFFPVISAYKGEYAYDIISSFPNSRFYLLYQDVGKLPTPPQAFSLVPFPNVFPDSKRRAVFNSGELFTLFEGRDIID